MGDGVFEGVGVERGDGFADGLRDDVGEGRLVDDASGFASCVVASAAVMGRARGGS